MEIKAVQIPKATFLVLLADLLGYASVETTRIYLQRSGYEQKPLLRHLELFSFQ